MLFSVYVTFVERAREVSMSCFRVLINGERGEVLEWVQVLQLPLEPVVGTLQSAGVKGDRLGHCSCLEYGVPET